MDRESYEGDIEKRIVQEIGVSLQLQDIKDTSEDEEKVQDIDSVLILSSPY